MTKNKRDILFAVVFVLCFFAVVLLPVMLWRSGDDTEPAAGNVALATEEAEFALPLELEDDDETLEIYGAPQVFTDEALTQEITGVVLEQPTDTSASIQFRYGADDTTLYIKTPVYMTGKAVEATTTTINNNTAELKFGDLFEYEFSDYTVSTRSQNGVKTLIVHFEATQEQTVFPFDATITFGGETYEGVAGANFNVDGTECQTVNLTFGIPSDLEVDLEGATITFDSIKEIHPSTVVPYNPNTVTE